MLLFFAIYPQAIPFAPWISCPPCCLSSMSRSLGSPAWLHERWIGSPSLLSASPSTLCSTVSAPPSDSVAWFVGPPFRPDAPESERSPTWYYDRFVADLAITQSLRVTALEDDFDFLAFVSFIADYTSTSEDIGVLACTHAALLYETLIGEQEALEALCEP